MKPITFMMSDFPNGATLCDQSECGFSLYRGVLVQWDEDHDERVIAVLDKMPAKVLDHLLIVQEHEGSISFVWKDTVPAGYGKGEGIDVPDGDHWNIHSSIALNTRWPKG